MVTINKEDTNFIVEKIIYLGAISNFITKLFKSEISPAYYVYHGLGKSK